MSSLREAVAQLTEALGTPTNCLSTIPSKQVDTGSGSIAFGSDAGNDPYRAYVEARGGRIVIFDQRVEGGKPVVSDTVSWDAEEFARVLLPALTQALNAS